MTTTLTKPKPKSRSKSKPEPKQRILKGLPHTPNYITILPPGQLIEEKMFEMGIDAAELARRMEVPVEIIEKLLRYEIPLTEDVAEKLQKATWMDARLMMRHETSYREKLVFAMEHPEIPAYLGTEIINQPKKNKKKNGKKIKMVEYTVPGTPIISQEELEEFKRIGEMRQRKRSPEELKESRQRLLEILLNCPVMTDEDLKGFEEARKEINECRLAYL